MSEVGVGGWGVTDESASASLKKKLFGARELREIA